MAVSAFKSTSKRGNLLTASSTAASAGAAGKADAARKVAPSRRSRSVSAFSRGQMDVDLEFANKRENPLYWAADVDSPRFDCHSEAKVAKFDGVGSRSSGLSSKVSRAGGAGGDLGGEIRRGRSVSRFPDAGGGNSAAGGNVGVRGVGRSLSRVDTGRRRRSVSRGHHGYSEVIMPRSRSSSTLSTENDMSHELVNPAEAELVVEVRGEYSRRLQESQQRARKLRAELAVEEHRGVELNQILDTIITDPETPDVKHARIVRKASMERRKVSKRLEEEALAYFDECVSISTFDGSEFSSLEDPSSNVAVSAEQHGNKANLPGGRASHSKDPRPDQIMEPSNPVLQNSTNIESPSSSSLGSSNRNWKRRFSFTDERKDGSVLEQELKSYVKIFTKDGGKKDSGGSRTVNPRQYDAGEYILRVPAETFLFERVALKNRIDSGGMVLCGCHMC